MPVAEVGYKPPLLYQYSRDVHSGSVLSEAQQLQEWETYDIDYIVNWDATKFSLRLLCLLLFSICK